MLQQKIQRLLSKLPEIEEQLGLPEIVEDRKLFRSLSEEYSYLSEVKTCIETIESLKKELKDNQELLSLENDPLFIDEIQKEISKVKQELEKREKELEALLIPPDPLDNSPTILELRAGTGGDEAALFVGDCVRMYRMYADKRGFAVESLAATPSPAGGFKEYIMVVSGRGAYRHLRHEGGTHRVQRVPQTEAQGRVHTSAITVAALPETDDEIEVVIEDKDIRVDTYRASGAGGQHVNTTDSAVRLTHIPTGIVAYSQEEKSQHKNKDKAMRLLKAKIIEIEREKKEAALSSSRKKQVGSGDRSERIRTYNYPQNRVTDHRINVTIYSLDRFMEGELDELIQPLIHQFNEIAQKE